MVSHSSSREAAGMMFSTWWPHSLSNFSQEETEETERSTSFRLPKASSNHSSDSQQSSKHGKKHSKRKSRKDGAKSKKAKKRETESKANPHVKFATLSTTDVPTCNGGDVHVGSDISLLDKQGTKEHCRVVNLKIPLPMQADPYALQLFKQQQAEQTSKQKNNESPRNSRRKSLGGTEENDPEKQPVLKSVELVNFASEEQSLYIHHQRTLAKSSCITVPTLANSSFLVNLTHRPDSASTWKDIHPPPPVPLLQHSPQKKPHPATEYPDLVLSTKQLSSRAPCNRWNAQHSLHNMQEHMFRPLFRYSHRSSCTPSPKHCSCIDGCVHCLTSTARTFQHTPLPLDKQFQVIRDKSTYRVRSSSGSVCTELPPLEAATGDSERDIQSLALQAQGLNIMRHPPKSLCTQKRPERISHGSTTVLPFRLKKEVSSYPDPLVGGLPSYHRKLTQMAALVTETIRLEKEKALKVKSKKAAAAASIPSTPRGSTNGSLGSL